MGSHPTVVALFAGIGGIELGLHQAGFRTVHACEAWDPARAVLSARFPDVALSGDIRELRGLPRADVVTAGFPCTDLSQAGRTAGIGGKQSGLVATALDLVECHRCTWLVLENVRNMLHLHSGRAMDAITTRLEDSGFRWAYRVLDSRFTGVPQRRQRVILLASRTEDPRGVLLDRDHGERADRSLAEDAFGFYWTEGLRGLGWARDAVPTLKGGSTIGISSPPAIWLPRAPLGHRLVVPGIAVGERLQGLPSGWTRPAASVSGRVGIRWKLVGNAVTVGVTRWLGKRMLLPAAWSRDDAVVLSPGSAWPMAAWGDRGGRYAVPVSMFPALHQYRHLRPLVAADFRPLSHKATTGFLNRLDRSHLRAPDEFRIDLKEHREVTEPR
jgi:DNA (cytosine-5)-methyltransferase 1